MTHTHYKRTGRIQSFRGLLADNDQERIRIQGSVGAVAWRITKFGIIPGDPSDNTSSAIMKIYKDVQTTSTRTIDFGDHSLLGVALWSHNATLQNYTEDLSVIFDNEIFNQDIYITLDNAAGNDAVNYYLELEEVKVSKASMAQLAVAAARRDPSLS